MKKLFCIVATTLLAIGIGTATAAAQTKAPDYRISRIKIVPFDSATGEFQEELKPKDDRSFFNDLSISLFVVVEIEGQAGSFEVGRKVQVSVTEGKRVKATRNEQIGLIGDGGKWYEAIWLSPSMCDTVTITAKITGQKVTPPVTRKVTFNCGE